MPAEKPTFEELVQEHAPFVRRTLAQMGVSARDLADVEQEVFRGADRGLPAFDPSLSCNPDTAVRGWLFGICERQAASHRRAEIKRGEVLFATEELDSAASASPSVEDRLIDHERRVLLNKLLDCLEPHRRAVVVAYELEGVAMADVAAALSIPVNTAWNRLRLGREDLRAAWKRMGRKDGRGRVVLSLGALFGGAAWCSEASAAAGGQTGSLASGPSGSLPAAQGAASSAASLGAAPSVVIAPAQASIFGWLALVVPAAVTGMLVLGAGEEPPALPETLQRPAAAVMASGPAAAPVLVMPVRTPASGAPVLAAGGGALNVSLSAAGRDVDPAAGSGAGQPVPAAAGQGQGPGVGPGQRAAVPAGQRPAVASGRPASGRGELHRERRYIERAAQALDRGDLRAAQEALDAHRLRHPDGNLAAERELLTARLFMRQGRPEDAGNTARAFLQKHPDSSFRGQLEQLVTKP